MIYYLNGQKFRLAWIETYGCWCRWGSNDNDNGIETHDDLGPIGKTGEDMLLQSLHSPVTQITSSANGSRKIRKEVQAKVDNLMIRVVCIENMDSTEF